MLIVRAFRADVQKHPAGPWHMAWRHPSIVDVLCTVLLLAKGMSGCRTHSWVSK